MWYRALQARWQIAGCVLSVAICFTIVVLLRAWLFDLLCWCCAPALKLFTDRHRVRWLARVLDTRLALSGNKRPRGAVLRRHFADSINLPERLHAQVRMVLDGSDSLLFGNRSALSAEQRESIFELRKKLEILEHELEHEKEEEGQHQPTEHSPVHARQLDELRAQISATSRRLVSTFK